MVRQKDAAWRWLDEPGRHRFGRGLYLQVLHADNRSWIFRYERLGKTTDMGLGSAGSASGPARGQRVVTLDRAAMLVVQARDLLSRGIDPVAQRKAERTARVLQEVKSITFQDAVRKYLELHGDKWRNDKHRRQWLKTLQDYAFPVIGRLPVADIDVGLVLRVIEPYWHNREDGRIETMSRVRGRIENVLNWAIVRGYRSGPNPAQWKGFLAAALPAPSQVAKVAHHKALAFDEMPAFMAELAQRPGMAARALEFTILTAARTGEVIGAVWSEIDLNAKLWTIPAGRMKAQRQHRVPLSKRVLTLLGSLPRESEFVFVGARKGSGMSPEGMAMVLRRMQRDDVTVHGMRSTFRDWAAERTATANHVVEMALAHTIGDKVEASYRRGDLLEQRAKLMAMWAEFCSTPSGALGNVRAIRAAG